MRIAISLTLAFFCIVSGMGAWRDARRLGRDPRLSRYLGVAVASAMTVWCFVAASWLIRH